MIAKKILLSFFVLFAGFIYFLSPAVYADVNDFVITDFSADYYLSKDNPHGSLNVNELIWVNFSDNNHGILRAIPDVYNGHNLNVEVLKVTDQNGKIIPYTTYKSNDNLVLKIGDPDKTVTGLNGYKIDYSLVGPISFYGDHDEFFWDVNGDQWLQPAKKVTARIHVPQSLNNQLLPAQKCFAGVYGQSTYPCTIDRSNQADGATTITAVTDNLEQYETLSFVIAFKANTFAPYTWKDELLEHKRDLIFALASLILASFASVIWWRNGKDYKGRGVLIAEYKPPKGVDPLRAGMLQDYRLDGRDVTAEIINLAVKKYITINEELQKKAIFFNSKKYSLELKITDTSKLSEYEDRLIRALFSTFSVGSKLELGEYNPELSKAVVKISDDLGATMASEGYYEKNPKKFVGGKMGGLVFLSIVLTFLAFFLSAPIGGFIGLISILVISMLITLMPRRSRLGVSAHESLKGLKYYIEVAEKDRIRKLQSAGAKYAKSAHEPTKTVELFEKLLPYAIIFGVERSWAKQFKDIYTTQPEWYQGNMGTFNSVILTNHILSSTSAVNSSFASPSSSGGSGFSGGGAGGGGGGGGGGGW